MNIRYLSYIIQMFLITIGVVLIYFGYNYYSNSMEMESIFDPEVFERKIMENYNDSNKYFELWDEHFNIEKFNKHDKGLTFIYLGSILIIISFLKKWLLKTPKYKIILLIVGLLSVILNFLALIEDLDIAFARKEYPPWADTPMIPFIGFIVISGMFSFWIATHYFAVYRDFQTRLHIKDFKKKNFNYWLLIAILLVLAQMVNVITYFDYYYIISNYLLLYFQIMLFFGYNKRNEEDKLSSIK